MEVSLGREALLCGTGVKYSGSLPLLQECLPQCPHVSVGETSVFSGSRLELHSLMCPYPGDSKDTDPTAAGAPSVC